MPLYHNQKAEDEADVARVQFADSPDVLGAMDSFYGVDLKSRVNIHNDEESDAKVKENRVDAIASGNDIYFGKGAYNMNDRNSRGLLAHEAAHVIQQGGLNGMNMNSPFGAEQGGVKDFFGAIGRGIVYGLSGVAGAAWGLATNWGWPFKKLRFGIKKKIKESYTLVKQQDKDLNRNVYTTANPLKMDNGMIKLSDGYKYYSDNLLPDTTARGRMGSFERGTTAPKIVSVYDHRDEDDFENTSRKVFNNSAEYFGNLKLRLLTSTVTGSIIAALINHNWNILRRAWPVRLVTGAVRWGGTVLVGLGMAIKGLVGKFKKNERYKADAAEWWERNAGPFFIPYFGRKVHNFFTWIRSKLRGRGDVKKSGAMYDIADEEGSAGNKIDKDLKAVQQYDNGRMNETESSIDQFGSLMNIADMDGAEGQGGITEDIQDAENLKNGTPPQTGTESASENEAMENMEAIVNLREDDLNDAPDEMKAELVKNSKIDPLSVLDDKAKNEMVTDILTDPNADELVEPVLTSEDKEKIKNTNEQELIKETKEGGNSANNPEPETTSIMPMMPLNNGEGVKGGGASVVTFRNAQEAIDDGWVGRPEGFEKTRDSYEQVSAFAEIYGSTLSDKFRRIQIYAENRDNNVFSDELYQEVLDALTSFSEATEESRNAKIWGMRYLRAVSNFKDKNAA